MNLGNELGKDILGVGSLGINVQILIGPGIPLPLSTELTKSIDYIEVTNTDSGRDVFRIKFKIGRSNLDMIDYPVFNTLHELLYFKPFNRVIILVNIGLDKNILIDGVITNQNFVPSAEPGKSTLTITGEDQGVLMDLHQIPFVYPNQTDNMIVTQIVAKYGLVPLIIPPIQIFTPSVVDNDPVQTVTDLQYVLKLAESHNYIFYIEPTDKVGVNIAYWGPPHRGGMPQKSITVNMGSYSNCESISFQNNSLKPEIVIGVVQDRRAQNILIPVIVPTPLPPFLSRKPAHIKNLPFVRTKLFNSKGKDSALEAYVSAVSQVDKSKDVINGNGELNTLRYGRILKARRTVAVRGVGETYDGLYYVNSVTHNISNGSYTQQFALSREGTGTIIPGVLE